MGNTPLQGQAFLSFICVYCCRAKLMLKGLLPKWQHGNLT